MNTTSPVTKPTLTYFNVIGRAEVARLMLEDAGADYHFVPVANWPDWSDDKARLTAAGKLAFGQVPLYEEPDGLTLVQSGAIARHLARKLGFNGADAHEEALIDQANEGVVDTITAMAEPIFRTPAALQTEAKQKLVRETLPAHLAMFEKLLEKNGNKGAFLVGAKLSYADLNLWVALELVFARVEGSRDALLGAFPAVKKLIESVSGRERIKAYIARDVYTTKTGQP
ncbi:glutathione transferase subfamily protein [Acanthamoeba castellanii str. Neff]|uniref:Glutathione transferase subfamily protein n=1 Tax=Acanthamoeba castellanii (strain ATCC 30010 / Neff) TaxID=1257118 RepID=L8GR87_ACACF|nr:glutathione transferase subfamily protein [Acanthamoeba castellanii str. Neff]ELR15158.1 glutathione transferase subfamily protein [Acanthamoeba castellanii str. Neff]